MKGISAKIITDEEKVRMHTNFAKSENAYFNMAYSDIATCSKEDGVLKIHTNTIHGWGIYVYCPIPEGRLKAGQKYGVSLRSSNRGVDGIKIMTADSTHISTKIVAPHWDGDKLSSVAMLEEENLVKGSNIQTFLRANNADYEIRDFRIWEIDDLGGAIVSILLIMLATTPRKEVAA